MSLETERDDLVKKIRSMYRQGMQGTEAYNEAAEQYAAVETELNRKPPRTLLSVQSTKVRRAVLKELNNRSGFDHWFESLDCDIQQEIEFALDATILKALIDG